MSRVALYKFSVAELHFHMLGLWHCLVIVNKSPSDWYFGVSGVGKGCSAMAYPEKIPAIDVSIRRCGWFARGVFGNVEVLWTLVALGLGVRRIEKLVRCARKRLDQQPRGFREVSHLILDADVPVGIIFQHERRRNVLFDDPMAVGELNLSTE